MAQQVILADQLVPRFHTIGRCNNYAMLESISCSRECKIVGQILLDHPLGYALTVIADVPFVYLQQFWWTVSKVPDPEDTIKVGYQGVVDKVSLLHKECSSTMANNVQDIDYDALLWIEEDYHFIKDDIPLVSVYTIRNVLVQGILILDAFLTKEIRATDDFKEYVTVFMNVDVPMNLLQPIEPGSHKDNPEHVDDDDKDAEKVDKEEGCEISSLETSTEDMQTPIPTPLRSPRTILSLDKNITQELTDTVRYTGCVDVKVLHQGVSQLAGKATEDLIENNLKSCIDATIIENHDAFHSEVPDLVIQVHPTTTTLTETTSSANLQQQLYFKMKKKDDDIHSHHDDHQKDDAPPKGEKRVKIHKASKILKTARGSSSKHLAKDSTTYVSKQQQQQQEWDAWVEETVIDEDEVIPEVETPELIIELQDVDKRVPTILDYERMKATLNDALKVVSITADQPHGLDFMEQITVMIENDKPDSFSEADFKYLNKNNIEDLYYLCRKKKFGIKSYQIKVNLTAPTLTFPSIEAHEPYFIADKPSTGLIYLNIKHEKRVMYLMKIVKFCDATLEKVLKDVKLKIFQSKPWRKPPSLGELDRDILREFEREITKRLSHPEQMRRWESFVNGRPILSTMKCL
ncbi:hypothetical protein Tco_0677589 [Tanacetum coccineum]|uniref:Uncharacterized protein n=1 Tax=Tanacetum coccineum TaxID=301880 RepID=A0ABQ4XDS3_9ASTR